MLRKFCDVKQEKMHFLRITLKEIALMSICEQHAASLLKTNYILDELINLNGHQTTILKHVSCYACSNEVPVKVLNNAVN